jgi:hypothetical protein
MKKLMLTSVIFMIFVIEVGSSSLGSPCVNFSTEISLDKGNLKKFLKVISKRESRDRQEVISKNGHLGKYQFSSKTLEWIGFDVSIDEFLSSSRLQDDAMIKYLKVNKRILRKIIKKWDKKIYDGELVTESGILAAAHLVGPGGVLDFFNKGIMVTDSSGVKITDYLFRYSGYDLRL